MTTSTQALAAPATVPVHPIPAPPQAPSPDALARILMGRCSAELELVLNRPLDEALAHLIAACWCETPRGWHGPSHLLSLLDSIDQLFDPASATSVGRGGGGQPTPFPPRVASEGVVDPDRATLVATAVFHDIVYRPGARDNEARSAQAMRALLTGPVTPLFEAVEALVAKTDWSDADATRRDPVLRRFFRIDAGFLARARATLDLLEYERGVFFEHQFLPVQRYRQGRTKFLRGWAKKYPEHAPACDLLVEHLARWRPRIAVYAGSFNPFHRGHLDILRQAEAGFDKVIVAVGENPKKGGASGKPAYERVRALLPFHDVRHFSGLLTDFIAREESEGQDVTLIRGIRQDTDLAPERIQLYAMQALKPDLKAQLVLCRHEHEIISSSLVRELEHLGAPYDRYVATTAEIYKLVDLDAAFGA